MSFDWNWFFSSFCQSAAALIGIIAAFIISRLLGLGEKINSTISTFDNLVIEFNRIVDSLSKRKFSWYTETVVKNDTDIADAIINGDYENLSSDEICEKIYRQDGSLFKVDSAVMDGFQYLYNQYRPNKISSPSHRALLMVTPGIWDKLNNERELIDQLQIESQTLIKRFAQNHQDLNSFENTIKQIRIIILILMVTFPLTVIYPLHFMPMAVNESPLITFYPILILKSLFTFKFLLLSIFFISIEGIFYYFLVLTKNLEIILANSIKSNSNHYRDIENYSSYFENRE